MSMASSTSYSVAVMPTSVGRGLLRWAVLGAVGVIALILALTHSTVAGAQAPANCIPINFGTCVANGTAYSTGTVGTNVGTTTTSNTGFPGNAAVSGPYFDNRYGFVQVVTDNSGNLIDVNPATGQRIFPFLPDFGFGGVIGNSFIGANFNNGFVNNGFANGRFVNGGVFNNGFNGFNGNFNNGFNGFNGFNGNFNNGGFFNNNGVFPAGATNVGGGVFTYNDNRFCGDGKLFFVVGRGSFCQNSGGFANGNGVFNGNGGFGFPNFRGFEVNTTTPQQATPVTAYAAPATPKAAAPVVQAAAPITQVAAPIVQAAAPVVQAAAPITQVAAPVVQAVVAPKAPVTAPAAAAPAAKVVTVMTAPTQQQAAPIVAKAQTVSVAPAASTSDPDDHRG